MVMKKDGDGGVCCICHACEANTRLLEGMHGLYGGRQEGKVREYIS